MGFLTNLTRLWRKPVVREVPRDNPDARFAACIAEVLKHEGGYVNDPQDPGGETKYGISKRSYPLVNISALRVEQARDIYRKDYWAPIWGDDLPPGIDLATLDYAVNSGVVRAIKCLQRAVGTKDDGVFGPATLAAVRRLPAPELAVRQMCDDRRRFLRGLPTYGRFGRGWERRVDDVLRAGLAMAKG